MKTVMNTGAAFLIAMVFRIPAAATTLSVSAAASLRDALHEIGTVYEKQSGETFLFNFGASSTLARQIQEGAPADIFISADELKRIWEKYKQSGNKSLRGGGGTGLGLYIVRQIVEAHGGEVTVASIEGVGTSMVLKLPVRRAA